jgi:tRNA threonylcarbamoyladenosine biosynthesis protein TsaB
MSILGFDTSTPATAVCLLRADGAEFEVAPGADELLGAPGHARDLLPRIAQVAERAGVELADLEAIAVGTGPGTFTGLRIGIATARALAHSTGAELRPVSSLAALAAGIDDPVRLPLIDARRGEVFGALHEEGEQRWEPFVARPEAVAERVREAAVNPLAAGDGSIRFREILEAAGIRVAPDGSQAHVVRALHVCRLATGTRPVALETVLPDYLRAPDAKPSA